MFDPETELDMMTEEANDRMQTLGYDPNTERREGLEALLLEGIGNAVTHWSETGYERVNALEREISELPDRLAQRAIQSERDTISDTGGYDSLEHHLFLEQLAAEYEDNQNVRRDLWDRILKSSEYKVTVEFEYDEQRTDIYNQIAESNAKAHNRSLEHHNRIHEDAELVNINTEVTERCFPETDPLTDMEEFVYYY